jgi:hypothetical protein
MGYTIVDSTGYLVGVGKKVFVVKMGVRIYEKHKIVTEVYSIGSKDRSIWNGLHFPAFVAAVGQNSGQGNVHAIPGFLAVVKKHY